MPKYGSSDLVKFGMIKEIIEGILEASAQIPVVLTMGVSPEYISNIVQDDTVSGAGEPIDARTNLRGLNLSTPAKLRFFDCRPLLGPALRDVYPAEVTIVGGADIDVVIGGTHLDGSTGPQLMATGVGADTKLDALITYGGVTAATHPRGGAEGLLLKIAGFTNAQNNWHRRIKAVWQNGTNSFIDFSPGWVGGAAGFFGEPLIAEVGASPTLKVGTTIRNRFEGPGVVSKTALWQFTDMVNNGQFGTGIGLVANDFSLSWSGKEGAQIDVGWIGHTQQRLAAADPTGQGFVDNNQYSRMLIAAEDLKFFTIVTASKPIVLSSFNLNSFNFQLAGSSASIDDVSGTSAVTGVRRGAHVPSGSIDYYLADDPRVEELAALGDEQTAEDGEISFLFRDRAGNEFAVGILSNEFSPTGPVPGSGGNTVGGSISFNGRRLTNTSRSLVIQEIAAS